MFKVLIVLVCLIWLCTGRPQHIVPPPAEILEFGVDSAGCTVGPSGKVCPTGPVQFSHGATGVAKEVPLTPDQQLQRHLQQQQQHHSNVFTGLVGPSGVIGPSGLVGPAGPLAFG